MYENQKNLPRLPLPRLEDTCKKLLEWSRPLISEEDYHSSEKEINLFQSQKGMGPSLQNKLEEWNQREEVVNWLEPFWYDTYLENRKPLPINSNVTFVLDKNANVKELSQSEFAAALMLSLFRYNKILQDESLEIDHQGPSPLCMSQYKTILGTSRIPGEKRDDLVTSSDVKHMVFIRNGHYYKLDVFNNNNELINYSTALNAIKWIVKDSSAINPHAIGNFTTTDRTRWARYRTQVKELNKNNALSLKLIETSLAIIVLDTGNFESDDQMFKHMLCGDSNNRWYDKSLQFILSEDGSFAVNYEHSGVDGTTLGNLVRYLYTNMKVDTLNTLDDEITADELTFVLNNSLKESLQETIFENEKAVEDLLINTLAFKDFGKNQIKRLKISPDSFIQLSIQLAQKKTFNKVYNTYEAVMTKQFLKGRTEAMRPVTEESIQFVENPTKDNLLQASKKHIDRIIECKNGYGIDRHLFGLYKIHSINFPKQTSPKIFNTQSYKKITENWISTSTSNSSGIIYAGYGPVLNDGYAVRYLIYNEEIHFVLSSKKHNETNLKQFKANLRISLDELSSILK